jgi:hypothetical protein
MMALVRRSEVNGRLSAVGTALSKQSAIQHVLVDGYVTAFTVVTECPQRAEKAGKHVTSITTPDGHTLHFDDHVTSADHNLTPEDELALWRKKRAR